MKRRSDHTGGQAVAPGSEALLRSYAAHNSLDGARLLAGLARAPRFRLGGWLLGLQPRAIAITLDATVYCREPLGASTYVHELVHVAQYAELGVPKFLALYFGLAIGQIARRALRGEPIDVMTASPLEDEAYAIEARFLAWARSGGAAR